MQVAVNSPSPKETVEPTVTHPNVTLSASCPNSGASLEIGSYINSISYAHTPSVGKYTVSGVDQASGITTSNFTYSVSNSVDTQTAIIAIVKIGVVLDFFFIGEVTNFSFSS